MEIGGGGVTASVQQLDGYFAIIINMAKYSAKAAFP